MTSPAMPEFLLMVYLLGFTWILYVLNSSVDFSSIFITEVLINEKVSLREKQDAIQDYKEVGVARRNRT